VRPATKEQVQSLGAKFIAVEDEEFKQAQTEAGYAKPMSAEYQKKQAELIASHIKNQDIVITTALIPGRPAPRLVTRDMVASMKPGSVIVDLAAERGGNCELTEAGKVVEANGVRISGRLNLAGEIPVNASSLYAKNLLSFLDLMIDKKEKALKIDWNDDIIQGTLIAKDGALVHPTLSAKAA
jgi:NAD(P) transhydrogenase subunit alpha